MSKYQKIGNFILLEKIAKGGMAEVFLAKHAEDIGLTKFFAIKKISTHNSSDPEFIEMFKNEAKVALSLSHRNIVPIYEFGVDDANPFYTMQFIDGQSLSAILKKGMRTDRPLSIPLCIFIAKEIAAGLDAAHSCVDIHTGKRLNIIHRDISPHNIVVSYFGEVKIIDFGIAKSTFQMDKTTTGIVKGKVGYFSPEQIEGKTLDGRTDIFSLGIVLWEMLTGHRLFLKSNEEESIKRILSGKIPDVRKYNPNVPNEIIEVVSKCLSKERSERYQNAVDLFKELNQILNKNYPDFFPEELGYHLKMLFGKEEKAVRKKLIEYSNLTIEKEQTYSNISLEGKTVVLGGVFRTSLHKASAKKNYRKLQNLSDQPVSTPVFDEKELVLDISTEQAPIGSNLNLELATESDDLQENKISQQPTEVPQSVVDSPEPETEQSLYCDQDAFYDQSSLPDQESHTSSTALTEQDSFGDLTTTNDPVRFDQLSDNETSSYFLESTNTKVPRIDYKNWSSISAKARLAVQKNLFTSIAIFSMLGAIVLHWLFTVLLAPTNEPTTSQRDTASAKVESEAGKTQKK